MNGEMGVTGNVIKYTSFLNNKLRVIFGTHSTLSLNSDFADWEVLASNVILSKVLRLTYIYSGLMQRSLTLHTLLCCFLYNIT